MIGYWKRFYIPIDVGKQISLTRRFHVESIKNKQI